MNLQLALNQANEQLREANDNRRAVDEKTYAVLSLSIAVMGILVVVRPWRFVSHPLGLELLITAGILYLVTVVIGLLSYFPREYLAMNAQAIMNNLDQANEWLMLWTAKDILRMATTTRNSVSAKALLLTISLSLFIAGTVFLAFSLAV